MKTGRDEFRLSTRAAVGEKPVFKASPLTYGWVMIINVFFRQLSVTTVIVLFSGFPGAGVGIISLIYLLLGVSLAYFRPYIDDRLSINESLFTIAFSFLCFLVCLKTFYTDHTLTHRYTNEIAYCDTLIFTTSIFIIIFIVVVLGLGIAEA
jgi:hypothetical protein